MSVAEMKQSIIEKVDQLDDKDVEVISYLLNRMNRAEKVSEKSIDDLYDDVKNRYGDVLEKLAQ